MKKSLVIFSSILTLIPLLVLSAYFYFFAGNMLRKNIQKDILSEVENSALLISEFLNERAINVNFWKDLSLTKISLEFNRPEALEEYLSKLAIQYKTFKKIMVLDKDNEYFTSSVKSEEDKDIFRVMDEFVSFQKSSYKLKDSKVTKVIKFDVNENGDVTILIGAKIQSNKTLLGYLISEIDSLSLKKYVIQIQKKFSRYNYHSLNLKLTKNASDKQDEVFTSCNRINLPGYLEEFLFLCASVNESDLAPTVSNYITFAIFTLILICIAYFYLYSRVIEKVLDPFKKLLNEISLISKGSLNKIDIKSNYPEVKSTVVTANKIVSQLEDYKMFQKQQANNLARIDITRQVVHDIKSPLSALDMIVDQLDELEESKRILIRSAVGRIHDITNDLTCQSEELKNKNTFITQSKFSIASLASMIISEKRIQFRNKANLNITFNLNEENYGLYVSASQKDLKRVFSNVINNAVESLGVKKNGRVMLSIKSNNQNAIIEITDNGSGIPNNILDKIGKKGFTYNKPNGSGLGLSHAIDIINSYSGEIKIETELGIGTTIRINLPLVNPPDSFVSEIKFSSDCNILVLDDDDSIHKVWDNRFNKYENIRIDHLTNPLDIFKMDISKYDLFLIDYEFLGSKLNGIDVIKKANLNLSVTYLITSMANETSILKQCQEYNIFLIPKEFAGFIPLICE